MFWMTQCGLGIMMKPFFWIITIVCLNGLSSAIEDIEIDRIEPRAGGSGGAVKIKAFGKNFDKELDWENNRPRTQMFLVSTLREYECDYHQAESDELQAVCYTRPMQPGRYYLRMKVAGVWLERKQYCSKHFYSSQCSFTVNDGRVPTIERLEKVSSPPHETVTFSGQIFTDIIASSNATASNGKTANLKRVWLTSGQCGLYRGVDEFFGLQVNEQSDEGTITCYVTSSYVGNQNISFIIDGEYGRSVVDKNLLRVSADNEIHMYQTYAVVEDINPKSGSLLGGTILQIKGKYFDDLSGAKAKVKVGDANCKVNSVKDNEITCTVEGKPSESQDFYPGGRGANIEMVAAPNVTYENYTTSEEYMEIFLEVVNATADDLDLTYQSQVLGFFVPSITANYKFRLESTHLEDKGDWNLYFETENKTLSFLVTANDWSKMVHLVGGQNYLYKANVSLDGICGKSIKLEAFVDETIFTSDQTDSVKEETHLISTTSTVVKEKQEISLQLGSEANVSNTKLALVLTCNFKPCDNQMFRIDVGGQKTVWMRSTEKQGNVEQFLMELEVFRKNENIKVLKTSINENITSLDITIMSNRGDFTPFIKVETTAQLTSEISSILAGSSDFKTLTFKSGDILFDSIEVTASADEMASTVLKIFQPWCPKEFLKDAMKSNAFIFYDAEDGDSNPTYFSASTADSLCGTHSFRNMRTIYDNAVPIRLISFKYLCFAYIGTMSSKLYAEFKYKEEKSSFEDNVELELEGLESTNSWNYLCFDLNDKLLTVYPKGRDFRITFLKFVKQQTYALIDNVYIGRALMKPDKIIQLLEKRLPPAVPQVRVKSVEVQKINSTFSIELTSYDCAYNYPLFEFAFVGEKQQKSADEVIYTETKKYLQIEVKRLATASPPIQGTFDIYFEKDQLEPILGVKANSTYKELKVLFEDLVGINKVRTWRWGSCRSFTWKIYYESPGGTKPSMIVNGTNLEGKDAGVFARRDQLGGLKMSPILGDFLRTAHEKPQVQVFINNIPSKCAGDYDKKDTTSCSFEWKIESTPIVTLVNPTEGSFSSLITVTGSGFDDVTKENNLITIGGIACDVASATTTQVSCNIGKSPGGSSQPFTVQVLGKGFADISDAYKNFSVLSTLDSVEPSYGSQGGCTEVVLRGSGFDSSITNITFGSSICNPVMITYEKIHCITESAPSVGVEHIKIYFKDSNTITTMLTFEFLEINIGDITSLSSTDLSVAGNETLTITGYGFNLSNEVIIGEVKPNILFINSSVIVVKSPSLPAGTYPIKLINDKNGCSVFDKSQEVNYVFSVTDINPKIGSLVGGTEVIVSGSGLNSDVKVNFGKTPCNVIEANDDGESLKCITSASTVTHDISNSGWHQSYGYGYNWNPSVIHAKIGDKVTFRWSKPDSVQGVLIGPYTCSSALDEEYDGEGFQAPPTVKGSFTYRVTKPGTIFFKSKSLLYGSTFLIMAGRIIVSEAEDITSNVSVSLNSHKAKISHSLGFTSSFTITPEIDEIEPLILDINTELLIIGSKLDSSSKIIIGGKKCLTIPGGNETFLKCQMSAGEQLAVGRHNIEVSSDVGQAMINIKRFDERSIVFYPSMESVSPKKGSQAGNTTLYVVGSGFTNSTQVFIGEMQCSIIESNYTSITCLTPSFHNDAEFEVSVVEKNIKPNNTEIFMYSSEATPVVDSINYSQIDGFYNVTFKGKGFGIEKHNLNIGTTTTKCVVTSVSDNEINCQIGRLPVGSNQVYFDVRGKGSAVFSVDNIIESKAELVSVYPPNGSVYGETKITIKGNGFVAGNTRVKFTKYDCSLMSVTLDHLTCLTPPLHVLRDSKEIKLSITSNEIKYPLSLSFLYTAEMTPVVNNIIPSSAHSGETITIMGSKFGSGNLSSVQIFPLCQESLQLCEVISINDSTILCQLNSCEGGPIDLGVHIEGKGLAAVYANFSYLLAVESVTPIEGSFGGGQNLTVNGHGFSNRTIVKIGDNVCEIISYESNLLTCITPSISSNDSIVSVKITVSNGDTSAESFDYTYQKSLTAIITDVTPNRGGTQGGTKIEITGTNLGLGSELTPNVIIGGVTCTIETHEDTKIVCVTEARAKGSVMAQVEVFIENFGMAQQVKADFYYIDLWSSKFTWGGVSIPTKKDFVIIGEGKTVMLDTHTEVLTMLLIKGGALIFDDTKNVSLHAENILITDKGLLQVGTEEKPYEAYAEIVLYGQLRSPELPIYGAKTLGLRDGILDLHGRHIPFTWSKLAETAAKGSTKITLKHEVNWKIGDYIVIATTGLRHSQEENEKKQITSISEDKKTLTLNEPLEFEHLGVDEIFGNTTVEFRAEVGLLTRNIVVRGSNDPQWQDEIPKCEEGFDTGEFATQTCFQGRFGEEIGSDEFGGSIMIHAPEASSFNAIARIEYVELYYMGQAFRLGRYPIHWHLMGDVSGMYVRGCSIHKTFNRAIAIHGTDNLLIDRNVVYDVKGGALFIEDGIETGIIMQFNLVVFCKQSTSLLNDDVTPAAYWVTNPNNTVIHNHAAGGTHFGFWYRMHKNPDGPSFTPDVCQQKVELGRFENNTVHSQGWFGLWIFKTYLPVVGGMCNGNIPSPAKFKSLVTWNSEKGAEWVECGAMQFHDFVMVNNEKAGIEMKMVIKTEYGEERGAMVKGGIIVGHSELSEQSFETKIGVSLPFSPGLTVENVKFYNFNRGGRTFEVTSIDGTCVELCGGFHYRMKGLEFNNVNRKITWRWEHEGILEDMDGSFSKNINHKILPYSNLFNMPECIIQSGIEYSGGSVKSIICSPSIKMHRFALNNIFPSSLATKDMIISNQFGQSIIEMKKKRLTHKKGWMAVLNNGKIHDVSWKDSLQFTNITYQSKFYDFFPGDRVIIRHTLAQAPDVIRIGETEGDVISSLPLSSESMNNQWYFNLSSRHLDYLVSNDVSRLKRLALGVTGDNIANIEVSPRIYRCKNVGCVADVDGETVPPTRETPENAFLWSSLNLKVRKRRRRAFGNSCIKLKDGGKTVEILRSSEEVDICWCIIDVDEVDIENLIVRGVVQFKGGSSGSMHFSVNTIQVLGGRIIAGHLPEDPFTKKLTIFLKGEETKGSDAVVEGVVIGRKAIACFGGCDFHGLKPNVHWTNLAETAKIGSNKLKLVESVDWKAGNEIIVTTTGYNSNETEKHVIESISGDTITLRDNLKYRHLGETYEYRSRKFDMRAEVGLLSRNIKIIGKEYDTIDKDAFGGRVIVGYIPSSDVYGWARITNVEFQRTGQEGFTDDYDPRFGLVYHQTGLVSIARPSYVHGCTFHDSYSTAIGVFQADGVTITDNIVHRPIHDGIRIAGNNIHLEHNLVTVALFRGSYNDRYEQNNFMDWHASYKLDEGRNITMINNVAAGSERLGFHTNGIDCASDDVIDWRGNVAHGCLHGVHILPGKSGVKCSLIKNFLIYKSWDFGLYHQTESSVIIRNTTIIDSQIAYAPVIFGPPSLSHNFENKFARLEESLLVGRSKDFDDTLDIMDEDNDKNLILRRVAGMQSKEAPKNPSGGKVGVLLPMFASGWNSAPDKSFLANKNYPAIRGLLHIKDTIFANYKLQDDGTFDLVFYTSPENEDGFAPTYVSGCQLENVEKDYLVIYSRPSLGKINPSDCVDMECDGMKTALIKDLDGGLLGAKGAIIPDAAFGWDDPEEKPRGLGDYRIPKTMLTRRNGERIPVDEIIDHRGIIGTNKCNYKDKWQAFDCHGNNSLDYAMLVIESMDADTETRRLSPVALLSDRYIDLENGPQDHGWCAGYTCQKRLSTFFTLVATDKHYEIYFTGYPPLHLRFHLLNVENDVTVRLGIYYPKPEKLDVYYNGLYIYPRNSELDKDGNHVTKAPTRPGQYLPAVNSTVHGDNFMDRRNDILYVTIRGSDPIDIKTAPAVIVKFGFPAISVDDFFETNLVNNLASYLGVPAHKIKVVDVVRETSRRRRSISKRDTEKVTYVIELDSGVVEESSESKNETSKEEMAKLLNEKTSKMIGDFQTGKLGKALKVDSLEMEATVATMELPPKFANETKEDESKVLIPKMISSTFPVTSFEELSDFSVIPYLTLLDEENRFVKRLGGSWKVQLTLFPQKNPSGGKAAEIIGRSIVEFKDGRADLDNISISDTGSHIIQFKIIEPATINISPTNVSIRVVPRQVAALAKMPNATLVLKNESLSFKLQLLNTKGKILKNIGYKGNEWKATVQLADKNLYENAFIAGITKYTFDKVTGEVITDGLRIINAKDYYKYIFKVSITSEPSLFDGFFIITSAFQYYSPGNKRHLNTSIEKNYVMNFAQPIKQGSRRRRSLTDELSTTQAEELFSSAFNNHLFNILNDSYVKAVTAENKESSTKVEFAVQSRSEEVAAMTEALMIKSFEASNTFEFDGRAFSVSDPSCFFEVDGVCKSITAEKGLKMWMIIVIALSCLALLIVAAVVYGKQRNSKSWNSTVSPMRRSLSMQCNLDEFKVEESIENENEKTQDENIEETSTNDEKVEHPNIHSNFNRILATFSLLSAKSNKSPQVKLHRNIPANTTNGTYERKKRKKLCDCEPGHCKGKERRLRQLANKHFPTE